MLGVAHGTAINAAPTRRRSASSTFQVRTAAPVGMASTDSDTSLKRRRRRSGRTNGSRPPPIRKKSSWSARAKTGVRFSVVSSETLATLQAHIPSGKHSNEPRCDMPPKRKPPLP